MVVIQQTSVSGLELSIDGQTDHPSISTRYKSGISILYSKNIFHIADGDLSSRLPLFLPSHNLQHITKMELSLALDWVKPPEQSDYHRQLEPLPTTLPHLQDLHVSFRCPLLTPVWLAQQADQREAIENVLLLPLDAMVGRLGSRCLVDVAFPVALWIPMMGRARRTRPNPDDLIVERAPRPPARPCGHNDRFWRSMPASIDAQDQIKDKARDDDSEASPTGYWLESGYSGPLPRIVSCFRRA